MSGRYKKTIIIIIIIIIKLTYALWAELLISPEADIGPAGWRFDQSEPPSFLYLAGSFVNNHSIRPLDRLHSHLILCRNAIHICACKCKTLDISVISLECAVKRYTIRNHEDKFSIS